MNNRLGALEDFVYNGNVYGGVAQRLLTNGFNTNALRPFGVNAVLRKDEWKVLDDTVVDISKKRLIGVQDLTSRGLVYNIPNGLGTTVLEHETISDMDDAEMNMDGAAPPSEDRVKYSIGYLPLPIVHSGFRINIRALNASRMRGAPLDTTQAAIAARKVAEKIETVLFQGASAYTFGGGTLRGYVDHPSRVTGSLGDYWNSASAAGSLILDDALAMKQASIDAKRYGPWGLYVPTMYETALDADFKANGDLTIRERLLEVEGFEFVKTADFMATSTHQVLLVELQPDTARMVVGLQPTTVEWESQGGMITHYKVMAIMVPQIRADQDGNCGIIHYSKS